MEKTQSLIFPFNDSSVTNEVSHIILTYLKISIYIKYSTQFCWAEENNVVGKVLSESSSHFLSSPRKTFPSSTFPFTLFIPFFQSLSNLKIFWVFNIEDCFFFLSVLCFMNNLEVGCAWICVSSVKKQHEFKFKDFNF